VSGFWDAVVTVSCAIRDLLVDVELM
jgi:hypothetical protein